MYREPECSMFRELCSGKIKSSSYLTVFGHNPISGGILYSLRVSGGWSPYELSILLTKRQACTEGEQNVPYIISNGLSLPSP